LLLKRGVEVNTCGRQHRRAPYTAPAKKQEKIAQLLIKNSANVKLQGEHGGALAMASWYGMENIVLLLLKRGVEVNERGGQYGCALYTALAKKQEKIAQLLIKNGVDVNLQGEHGGALTTVLWFGMENIVPMLLERGAEVNARGGGYGSALHKSCSRLLKQGQRRGIDGEERKRISGGAIRNQLDTALALGQEKTAWLLIENGADVIFQVSHSHGAALTTASWYGMESIVLLLKLLQRGVEVNAQGGTYNFALHTSLAKEQEKIAQFLIENGADVNLPSQHGGALTTALWFGMENIVPMLLERGAEVNARGGRYGSALRAPGPLGPDKRKLHGCSSKMNIIILLIQHGVEVNARGGPCDFALHAALITRHGKIARLLLENGADVNALGETLCCPLELAAYWGNEDLVRLLIDNGADPNAHGGMALLRASWVGRETAIRLLLENGADPTARDFNNWSPIAAAASSGHKSIVRLLIENGATIDAPGGQHWTALIEASDSGHENILEILIDNGANVDARDRDHRTALATASRAGHERIVQFLLDHGVDVNAQDGIHGNATKAASNDGHEGIVKLLIQHGATITEEDVASDCAQENPWTVDAQTETMESPQPKRISQTKKYPQKKNLQRQSISQTKENSRRVRRISGVHDTHYFDRQNYEPEKLQNTQSTGINLLRERGTRTFGIQSRRGLLNYLFRCIK
ncbi:ankyrin repeat-containing domain protein, partial [Mycena olivaceomarginata]